jgi:hypothetical protein
MKNPWGSKHVEDVKNRIKALIWKIVYFVDLFDMRNKITYLSFQMNSISLPILE